jgi:hypothetical protein
MRGRATVLFVVLLMVSSALAVLASSGWTPQGGPELQLEAKAYISANAIIDRNNTTATPDFYISLNAETSNLILALVFGFGLIAMSFIDKKRPIWATFAGFVWLTLSVAVLYQFGANQAEHLLWMVIGIGIGLILMLEGSMAYAAHRKQEGG